MEIEVTDWTIPGSDGQPIYGSTHLDRNRLEGQHKIAGVLICSHGFKGYKDYGFLPALCHEAAQQGMIAHRFNFSHSGMTPDYGQFEQPLLFEKDTWGRQVYDLIQVNMHKDFVWRFPDESSWDIGSEPIVYFGHSRGGVTCTLAASRFHASDYYKRYWPDTLSGYGCDGLITAAAPDYACNLDDLAKAQLRAEGRLFSPSGRTGQDLYVGLDWLEEIERDPELYDPVLAAAHVKCPMLMLHGDEDETVPLECADSLHHAATPNSELAVIKGADHVFNCPNPLPADTPAEQLPTQTRELIRRSVDFAMRCCEEARG